MAIIRTMARIVTETAYGFKAVTRLLINFRIFIKV